MNVRSFASTVIGKTSAIGTQKIQQ